MFNFEDKIKDENVNLALKAYYNFLIKINGLARIYPSRINYTTDKNKQSYLDQNDPNLQEAIKIVRNDDNCGFLLEYTWEDLKSIIRFRTFPHQIIVSDIVFTSNVDVASKLETYIQGISYIEDYAYTFDIDDVVIEVPDFDKTLQGCVLNMGYILNNQDNILDKYPTKIYEKSLKLKDRNEYGRNLINK